MANEDEGNSPLAAPGVPVEVRQQLLDRISPALEGLVEADKQPEVVSRVLSVLQAKVSVKQTQVTETRHQGVLPLPPPEMMEHYERLHPGITDRLLTATEKSQQAEIDSVVDVNRRTDRYQLLALGAGFLGLILVLGAACWLASSGKEIAASTALGVGIAGVIGAFVNARFTRGGRPDAGSD